MNFKKEKKSFGNSVQKIEMNIERCCRFTYMDAMLCSYSAQLLLRILT